MGLIKKIKDCVRSIPEFSEKNYNIVGYVFAALITISGLFLIYEVVTTDALVFKANWNMFKSHSSGKKISHSTQSACSLLRLLRISYLRSDPMHHRSRRNNLPLCSFSDCAGYHRRFMDIHAHIPISLSLSSPSGYGHSIYRCFCLGRLCHRTK